MAYFDEAQLEQSIIDLFGQEDYQYTPGGNIVREQSDVLLRDDLVDFLKAQYKREGITDIEVQTAIKKIESEVGTLYENNRQVMRCLMDGFTIKREDPTKVPLFINLIDFDKPRRNIFRGTAQARCHRLCEWSACGGDGVQECHQGRHHH